MPHDTFKEFVFDQLSPLPELRAKAMFGGHGLYCGEWFFAVLFEGRLYFKVDDVSRAAYAELGMEPFTYTKAKRVMTMGYWEVPPEILEDRDQLLAWARQAVQVAVAVGKKRALPKRSAR
jgi:DNA transformation protein